MLSKQVENLAAFAPTPVVRNLYTQAQNGNSMDTTNRVHTESLSAAILFADISGFTALTEALSRQSSNGAEELTSLINLYFTRMITHIESYNGIIVRLSGDAITAIFRADEIPGDDPTNPLLYAIYAAIDMQIAMIDFQNLSTSVGEASLALKIGIGNGAVFAANIGGVFDRWEYLIGGNAIEQASYAEKHANPGMVVLSPKAASLLNLETKSSSGCVTVMGEEEKDNIFLDISNSFPRPSRSLPMYFDWESLSVEQLEHIEKTIRYYVPAAITKRMVPGREQAWLAELRRMTIMFVGVGGLNYEESGIFDQLQTFLTTTQKIIYRYEGSLNKIAVDDKGTVLLILFGAPPLAHEDDPVRALACAQELHQTWSFDNQSPISNIQQNGSELSPEQISVRIAIGITTETVFAGPVGSPTEFEYTVMGDAANLASRLMQAAKSGETLCDHSTYNEVKRQWSLEILSPIKVKGKSQPVRVYRFSGMRALTSFRDERPLVGRERELATLNSYVEQVETGYGCIISINGEGGMGKTSLLHEFLKMQEKRSNACTSLVGAAHSIGQQTPYLVWREVLTQYFELERLHDSEQREKQVVEIIQQLEPSLEQRLPLLNDVLDIDLPETAITRLSPRQRRDSLVFLILQLLQIQARNKTLIIVLDDMHWADSLSWDLALDVGRAITHQPIMLLLSYREPDENNSSAWAKEKQSSLNTIIQLGQHYRLYLSPLDTTAIEKLAVAYLNGKSVSRKVSQWILERSQGNPFFVEETIRMLREQSALVINAEDTWDLKDEQGLNEVPATLKGIIQSHLDKLQPGAQLTCKVASVIGRVFSERVVAGIFPMEEEVEHLHEHLTMLASQNITPLESYEPEVRYQFKSALTQDVAYNSLLLTQRQKLHQAVAEWYEKEYAANLDPYVTLVAEHYRHTEELHRFLYFTERAGQLAAANYATAEALSYLTEAIELLKKKPDMFTDREYLEYMFSLVRSRAEVYEHSSNTSTLQEDLAELSRIADLLDDAQYQIQAHLYWGRYYQTVNDYPAADRTIKQAMKLGKQIQDQALLGETMNLMARNSELRSDYYQALWWGLQAMEYCQEVDDKTGVSRSLNLLGVAYVELGDYTQAAEYHQQALDMRRAIEDRWGAATSLYQIGNLRNKLGKPREALRVFQEALEIRRSIGDRSGEAFTLLSVGSSYQALGDLSAAQTYQSEALDIWRELGNQYGEATLLVDMSDIATALGDFQSAQRYATEGLEIARAIGNRQLEAYCLAKWGNASRELAAFERREAAKYASHIDIDMDTGESQELQELDSLHLASLAGRLSSLTSRNPPTHLEAATSAMNPLPMIAKQHHRAAYQLAREIGLRRLEAYALHHLGEWEWEWGDPDPQKRAQAASDYWEQSINIRQEIGEWQFVHATRCRQAEALTQLGELDKAKEMLEEIWQEWGKNPPSGEDEDELREGYLAMYHIWKMFGYGERATASLAWAYQGIQDRAFSISDPSLRQSFLTRVSVNEAINEAWEAEMAAMD